MKFFHCSREFIEHPATLVESLRERAILLDLDGTQLRAVGCVDNVDICLILHPKRFRGNLSIVEYPNLLPIWARSDVDRFLAVLDELGASAEHPSRAWIATQPAIGDDALAALDDLGICAVRLPVEDEIRFVSTLYGHRPEIQAATRAVREQQQLVTRAVAEQRFEDAAFHAKSRERLLDTLYDLSMC